MPEVRKSVIVAAAPEAMFALVDAVEDYPRFLPWCSAAEVLERTDQLTHARLHIDFHGLKTRFATVNRKEPPRWMHLALSDGPFERFRGHWQFVALGAEGCRVELTLEYAFASRAIEAVLGPVFSHVAATLVESFVERARQAPPEGGP